MVKPPVDRLRFGMFCHPVCSSVAVAKSIRGFAILTGHHVVEHNFQQNFSATIWVTLFFVFHTTLHIAGEITQVAVLHSMFSLARIVRVFVRQFVTRSTIAAFMAFMIASHDPSVSRDGVEPTDRHGKQNSCAASPGFLFVCVFHLKGNRGLEEGAND